MPASTEAKPAFRKAAAFAAVALSLPALALLLAWHARLDFWYDELYTLDHFVFAPLSRTLTDYPVPNNHVFFNAINNLYVTWLGVADTFALMDHPWIIRGLMLIYAAGTVGYTWRIANRHLSPLAGVLAVLVLVTTVPFLNFAVQVRGYSLSMLLLMVTVYHMFGFEDDGRWPDAVTAIVAAALAVYTIPSNVYVLLSMAVFYGVCGLIPRAGSNWLAGLLPLVGMLLAGLLYLPMVRQMMSCDDIRSHGSFHTATLVDLMPKVLWALLSHRYLFAPAIAGGAIACLVWRRHRDRPSVARRVLFCAAVLILPFVASFVRGDNPEERIFVVLAPLLALLVAGSIDLMLPRALGRKQCVMLVVALGLYCYVTLAGCLVQITWQLRSDIETGRNARGIFCSSYLAEYEPAQVLADLAARYKIDPAPIFVYEYGDDYACPRYLQKSRLPCLKIAEPGQVALDAHGRAYVLTAHPHRFVARMRQARPNVCCRLLTDRPRFQSILLCHQATGADDDGAHHGMDCAPYCRSCVPACGKGQLPGIAYSGN